MALMPALVLVHFNPNREVALIFFFKRGEILTRPADTLYTDKSYEGIGPLLYIPSKSSTRPLTDGEFGHL